MKGSKSFGAADRTIAALRFHAERVKEKSGDGPAASNHNEILGNMVDLHHRNMSMVGASLLKYEPLESSRTSDRLMIEVDEFDSDCDAGNEDGAEDDRSGDDGEEGDPSGSQAQSRSRHVSSNLNDPPADLVVQLKPSPCSVTAKKTLQEPLDPVVLFRQMRAATMSRTGAQHIPGSVKGAYAFVQPPPELEPDKEDTATGVKTDLATLRAKSFLRPEQTASPADEMLAQIRGRKWDADGSGSANKSSKFIALTASKSDLRPELPRLSSSLGTPPGSVPTSGSKSFSTGNFSRRSTALPGVSVDASPSLHLSDRVDFERTSVRHPSGEGSTSGLLSRLRHMMKR